jgi:threonylcarbamoyladenosine tRNA methylthiotransferase MtaB
MADIPQTFRVHVLGCRVNHAEKREIEGVLRSRGLIQAAGGVAADLEIVHTCGVTGRAAAKSRQAIRHARRTQTTHGTTLITGCLTGTDPDQAAQLTDANTIAFDRQHPVPQAVADWFDTQHDPARQQPSVSSTDGGLEQPIPLPITALPNRLAHHIRAEVHIQDGCNAHCTFCIIPRGRPTLRSKRPGDVVREVTRLVELGHPEIVLTGIFLGAYQHHTAIRKKQRHIGACPLAELVHAVAQINGLQRLRLSSLEPGDVSNELLDAMVANNHVVTPHLHLPLQSGSDAVLRRMNRQYRVGDYLDMVSRITAAIGRPGLPPAITTDIMTGFPGESDEDFEHTLRVAKQVGFLHMHVFRFSPRSGTAAARWTTQAVPAAITQARSARLRALETRPVTGLAAIYRQYLLNQEVRVIAERPDPNRSHHWLGRCDHYCMVSCRQPSRRGEIVRAIVRGIEDDILIADPVSATVQLPVLGSL